MKTRLNESTVNQIRSYSLGNSSIDGIRLRALVKLINLKGEVIKTNNQLLKDQHLYYDPLSPQLQSHQLL